MSRVLINRREEADGDIEVPLTFQAQDIQNLDSRMANYSLSGTLPDTPRNRALVSFAESITGASSYPYLQIPARLVDAGVELIGSNGYMVINKYSRKQGYDVSFYSGNFDFFESAKALMLQSLTITNPNWGMADILAGNSPTGIDVFWPIINWNNGPSTYWDDNIGGPYGVVDARTLYPAVKVDYIMGLVAAALGYTFTGMQTTNACMPMMGQKADAGTITELTSGYLDGWGGGTGAYVDSVHEICDFYATESADPHLQWSLAVYGPNQYGHYKVNAKGRYKFRIEIRIKNIATIPSPDEDLYLSGFFVTFPSGGYDGTQIYTSFYTQIVHCPLDGVIYSYDYTTGWIDCSELDKITMAPQRITTNCKFDIYDIKMTVVDAEVDDTAWNYSFPIAANLPVWTFWDFIKYICQLYQLIPFVDYLNKTVYFWNYSAWYDKAVVGTHYDWSEKLDLSENPEVSYSMDFAQSNLFKYKEDSSNGVQGLGDGSFLIADKTLEKEKTIIESGFACTDETYHFNEQVQVAHINCKVDGAFSQGYEPRILLPIQRTAALCLEMPSYLSSDLVSWYTGTMAGLTWNELLTNCYPELVNLILNKTKLVRCFIYLTPLDISTLDLTKPVYIKAFGRFFIINKISNYLPGKSTEVELIRM